MTHVKEADHNCEYCHMTILAGIRHECDPSICRTCKGNKVVWGDSRYIQCPACNGTGKTIYK